MANRGQQNIRWMDGVPRRGDYTKAGFNLLYRHVSTTGSQNQNHQFDHSGIAAYYADTIHEQLQEIVDFVVRVSGHMCHTRLGLSESAEGSLTVDHNVSWVSRRMCCMYIQKGCGICADQDSKVDHIP
jgi:hypothetical protein